MDQSLLCISAEDASGGAWILQSGDLSIPAGLRLADKSNVLLKDPGGFPTSLWRP